ncbi:MAG TPA: hypothetical protein VFI33_01710 [Puia sp.]|nr:hypothetical protein [Puia sp.]
MLAFFEIPVDFFTQKITTFAEEYIEMSQGYIREAGIGFATPILVINVELKLKTKAGAFPRFSS